MTAESIIRMREGKSVRVEEYPANFAENLNQTLDHVVRGILSFDPPQIQCDGCGHIAEGTTGKIAQLVLTCGIQFNPARNDDRRLCAVCRATEWPETVR